MTIRYWISLTASLACYMAGFWHIWNGISATEGSVESSLKVWAFLFLLAGLALGNIASIESLRKDVRDLKDQIKRASAS